MNYQIIIDAKDALLTNPRCQECANVIDGAQYADDQGDLYCEYCVTNSLHETTFDAPQYAHGGWFPVKPCAGPIGQWLNVDM